MQGSAAMRAAACASDFAIMIARTGHHPRLQGKMPK